MEVKITSENFKSEVLESDVPVVLDFWATWCGPCRMIAPELEKFDAMMDGKIKIGKVNVDEEEQLAKNYNIEVIPCLILFENGKMKQIEIGYFTADEIKTKFFG